MIKVMIVDDEYLAREGMKKTIEWETYGCEICAEAQDGCEGVELARKFKPDLIITDINMPGKNGIEMAEEIRTFIPGVRIIIITGYDDFEYARKAVKINAFDFLLKPIDENELLSAIEKVVVECKKIKIKNEITTEKILLDMMRGKITDPKEIREELNKYGIQIDELVVICVQNDSYENNIEVNGLEALYAQNNFIKELAKNEFNQIVYIIECHEDKLALLVSSENLESCKDIHKNLQEIQNKYKERFNATITIGVSAINFVDNIKETYDEGKQALKNRLYTGKGSIIYFEDTREETIIKNTYMMQEEKDLIFKLRACDKQKVEKNLKHIYFHMFKSNKTEDTTVKQVSIELILRALEILVEFNIPEEKVVGKGFNVYKKTARLSTIQELYAFTFERLIEVLNAIKEANIEANENGIEKAIEYMKENYHREISLSEVAKMVYLSESYLSRKIKKTTGTTFVEYITKLRIEKSIEYLNCHNAKINEIALKVGYAEYRYFSHIFKKHTGYTPSEFLKNKVN